MSDAPDNEAPARNEAPESQSSGSEAAAGNTDDRNLALITHLSGIILWFIVPLIVWLMHKDNPDKGYITGEAKEALNFQITVGIAYIVSWILTVVFIGIILWWITWVLSLVFCIIAALQVSQSGSYRYPINLRLIK